MLNPKLYGIKFSSRASEALAVSERLRANAAERKQLTAELESLVNGKKTAKKAAGKKAVKKKPIKKAVAKKPAKRKRNAIPDDKLKIMFVKILSRKPLTVNALGTKTNLSGPLVDRILDELLKEKRVKKVKVRVNGRALQGWQARITNGKSGRTS